MRRSRVLLVGLWIFHLTAVKFVGASAPNGVIVERNVPVKMRDGVVLRADIYRPKTEGKFPVIGTLISGGEPRAVIKDTEFSLLPD